MAVNVLTLTAGAVSASYERWADNCPVTVQETVLSVRLTVSWALDSSVGISTRYGLECPEIEFWWGARFFAPVQTGPGSHSTSYTVGNESFSLG